MHDALGEQVGPRVGAAPAAVNESAHDVGGGFCSRPICQPRQVIATCIFLTTPAG